MNKLFAVATALVLSAHSASAFIYDCDITRPSPDGWMGDRIVFSVDEEVETVAVVDAMIMAIQKAPILTKLETQYGRHVIRWKLKGVKATVDGGPPSNIGTADYKASVFPNNKLVLTVHLTGFDNVPRGEGVCTKKKKQ